MRSTLHTVALSPSYTFTITPSQSQISQMLGAPSELDALLQLEVVVSSASAQGNQLSTLLSIELADWIGAGDWAWGWV